MDKILTQIKNDKKVIEIHQDDTGHFAVGRIVDFDAPWILLNAIDPAGVDDGFLLLRSDVICSILTDTHYLQRLDAICEKHEPRSPHIAIGTDGRDLLQQCLSHLRQKQLSFSFLLCQGYENAGRVIEIGEDYLSLQIIDKQGHADGSAFVRTEDIRSISFEGIYERLREVKIEK